MWNFRCRWTGALGIASYLFLRTQSVKHASPVRIDSMWSIWVGIQLGQLMHADVSGSNFNETLFYADEVSSDEMLNSDK